MTTLVLRPFGGLVPRTAAQLLPDSGAQQAVNCILTSGEIRPTRAAEFISTPTNTGALSIFRAEYQGTAKWTDWATDVDYALVPLSVDVEPRYVWTGDGEPKYTKFSNFPSTYYMLGVPTPLTAPTVTPTGGTGSTETRYYTYTFQLTDGTVLWEGTNSPVSAQVTGKVDSSWAITNMDSLPANSGTGTAVYTTVTTFTNTGNHWLRVGDQIVMSSTTLTVASVPSATTFTVAGNYASATSWARKTNWNTAGMTKCIYRTAGTTAQFQLVASGVSGTTYTDTLLSAAIPGNSLITQGWVPPPTGMKGIMSMPDGSMAGFVNNILYRSVPYQPHAWPLTYQRQADYEIIGIAGFGTTIVAATAANPYVADGVDPTSVTFTKVNQVWPCLSKRSVASIGDGVIYASKDGLACIGPSGAVIWTKDLYTVEEWTPLNPATMIVAAAQEKVFITYTVTGSTPQIMIIAPGEPAALFQSSLTPTEIWTDPRYGQLYIVDAVTGISRWNTTVGNFMTWTWQSKDFRLPQPVNFGAAQLIFESASSYADTQAASAKYQADITSNQNAISLKTMTIDYGDYAFGDDTAIMDDSLVVPNDTGVDKLYFTVFANKQEVLTKLVTDNKPFKLPAGYKEDNYSFQVMGTVKLLAVKIAQTMNELRTV